MNGPYPSHRESRVGEAELSEGQRHEIALRLLARLIARRWLRENAGSEVEGGSGGNKCGQVPTALPNGSGIGEGPPVSDESIS